MNPTFQDDVTEFRSWLNQSIRRAWILAIAVAIPGAFLLILWFPYSTQMLITVAILGIAIGAISDAVERVKRRRLEEISEITTALRRAVQELSCVIEGKGVAGTVSVSDDPSLAAHQAAITAHEAATKRILVAELRFIHRTLETILVRLPADPDPAEGWFPPKGDQRLS